jgi:hypothetical protein
MAIRQRPTPARTRSIRTTLAGLLMLPVLALIGLWALLATITLGDALSEHNDYRVASSVGSSSDTLLATLEQERAQTFFWLSSPNGTPTTALVSSRRADDAEIARYERIYPSSLSSSQAVFAQLGKLARIRTAVDARTLTATDAFQDYSATVDGLFDAYASTTMPNTSLYEHTVGALQSGRALEQFTRELTLSAAAQFNRGQIPAPDAALFADAVANQRLLVKDALALADSQLHADLVRLYGSPTYGRLAALEDRISATSGQPAPIPVLVAWGQQAQVFLKQFEAVARNSAIPIGTEAGQISRNLFLEAGLAGGLGLVAVAGVVLLMLRFGRRIRTELTDLHDGAEAMASVRLPALVERLSEGDDVDVALASPPLATGKITEIVSVAEAFSAVQRTAVSAAVGQASLRKGVSKVFVNLSLRNQSILHRQLGMLDAMERATDDPAALADLFRLDHLTTRMRRHAESLIILSGASTGRSWREPVRLVDVLRAAVAEVEDYTRIEVVGESAAAVLGPAANDVVHLLAELMENATSFSPPATRVETRVDTVGTGVAIEIEDRGLGLTKSELAAINARLDSPPGFDLAETEHLGLFVVGQLASRHRISVALRRSHYGGITAVVLLPNSVIVPLGEAAPALRSFRMPTATLTTGNATGSALSLSGSYPSDEPRTTDLGGPYGAAGAPGHGRLRGPFEPLRQEGYSTEPFRLESAAPPAPTQDYAGVPQPAPDRGSWSVQGSAQADTYRGLPRRVRQASLAPELHNGRTPAAAAEPSRYEPSGRSAEQTRSKMSSLQDGWQRGRADELDWPADSGGAPGRVPWDAGDGNSP